VFGQELRAQVPPTALCLLALQDRRSDPSVKDALNFLEQAWPMEPAAMALGLSAIAMRLFGRPAADIESAMLANIERAERLGNLHALAIALFALTAQHHGAHALHLSA
jgi:hypothetical protein